MRHLNRERAMARRTKAKMLTRDDILDICKLATTGKYKCIDIAKKYDISPAFTSRIIRGQARQDVKRKPIDLAKYGRKIHIGVAQKVIHLKRQRLTNKQIEARLGISVSSIAKVLQGDLFPELDRTNLETRLFKQPLKKLTKEECIEICKKIDNRIPQYKLAEEYGVSRGHICRIAKGKIYPNVRARYISANTNSGRKARHESIKRQAHWRARKNNMVYNEYGMLVPIDQA